MKLSAYELNLIISKTNKISYDDLIFAFNNTQKDNIIDKKNLLHV